jgi:hypothetical protein
MAGNVSEWTDTKGSDYERLTNLSCTAVGRWTWRRKHRAS